MKLYLTVNNSDIIKNYYYSKLESPKEIICLRSEYGRLACQNYKTNIFERYLLHNDIMTKFTRIHIKQNISSLIYIVEDIDEDFIIKLYDTFKKKNIYFTEVNLIDYIGNIDPDLWKYFTNIL